MLRRVQVHVAYPIQQPIFSIGFPGQPGGNNLVGHTAAPAASSVWPGGTRPGAWPGSFTGGGPTSTASYAAGLGGGVIPSGTPGNPTIVAFVDFASGSNPNSISTTGADSGPALHDVTFYGCRFSNASFRSSYCVECFKSGSSNIAFIYCSIVPSRVASVFYSKVVGPAVLSNSGSWPAASVGTGLYSNSGIIAPVAGGGAGTYQTACLSGCQFALAIGTDFGTYLYVDHCDIWGHGFGISPQSATNPGTGLVITDNWIHDPRFPVPPDWDNTFNYVADTVNAFGAYVRGSDNNKYLALLNSGPGSGGAVDPVGDGTGHWTFFDTNDHTNGICYAQGTSPGPQNVTIRHNTIAGIGNTEAIGWQSTSTNYVNDRMINNYLSGYSNTIDLGTDAAGSANTGWVFTDNIIATDIAFVNCTRQGTLQSYATQFTSTGNLWRRNKFKVFSGDNWSTAGQLAADGQFVQPASGSVFSTTDWAF
jgi:hypothetical protein